MLSLKAPVPGVRQEFPFAWGNKEKKAISSFFVSGQSTMLGYQKLGERRWAKTCSVSYIFKRLLGFELIW